MMIGLALAITLGIAYIWLLRGFFSSLLHLMCVIAAGAIAFAFWEPLAGAVFKIAPAKGFLAMLGGMAFGIGLIVPFALSLAVLRICVDKILPANAQAEKVWDMVGGGICGVGSGVITAGILVIGCSMLWTGNQSALGYQRLKWDNSSGSLTSSSKLVIPVDDIVAGLYGKLSTTAFSVDPSSSLAVQYPSLADVPSAIRRSNLQGKGRNFLKAQDVSLAQVWVVGADENWVAFDGSNISDLLKQRDDRSNQPVQDRHGDSLVQPGAYLAGFVVEFKEGARERKSAQVNMTPAQARLVSTNADGEAVETFPVAMISRADLSTVTWARFRMSDEDGIGTVAGDATPLMGFEFVVPPGYKPTSLYIKNIRIDVSKRQPDQRFATAGSRQSAIDNGSLMRAGRTPIREERAVTVQLGADIRSRGIAFGESVRRVVLQDGTTGGLKVDSERKISDGVQKFKPQDMHRNTLDKQLRVDKFSVSPGTELVQISVTPGADNVDPAIDIAVPPISDTSRDLPVYLLDTQGNLYSCVGYVYEDQNVGEIRFTKDVPIPGLASLPRLPSRTQRTQTIVLLFEVTKLVDLQGFVVGDELMVRFGEAIKVQRN